MRKIILIFTVLFSHSSFAEPPAANGRFQLVQLGQSERDQFMIDTQTGKIWKNFCMNDTAGVCHFTYWSPQEVVGINSTTEQVVKKSIQIEELKKKTEELKKKAEDAKK